MKRTSRSSRLVSEAARSPALAMTGPEVARKFTPSSRARICASVVLPKPGRTDEQHMIERFAALARGADEDVEIGARLLLADEFVELLRTQRGFRDVVLAPFRRNHAARWRSRIPHSVPRLYLFGSNSVMVVTCGSAPFGTIDPRLRIVIADELTADAAGRNHLDALVRLVRLADGERPRWSDAVVAAFGDGAADRDRLGANRDAADIGVDIHASHHAAVARAQSGADLLPLVAVTAPDRAGGGLDQFRSLVSAIGPATRGRRRWRGSEHISTGRHAPIPSIRADQAWCVGALACTA